MLFSRQLFYPIQQCWLCQMPLKRAIIYTEFHAVPPRKNATFIFNVIYKYHNFLKKIFEKFWETAEFEV